MDAATVVSPDRVFWFCPSCAKLHDGHFQLALLNKTITAEECDRPRNWCALHENGTLSQVQVEGISVVQCFVSGEEESVLVSGMEKEEWKLSQSGRRKQVGNTFNPLSPK